MGEQIRRVVGVFLDCPARKWAATSSGGSRSRWVRCRAVVPVTSAVQRLLKRVLSAAPESAGLSPSTAGMIELGCISLWYGGILTASQQSAPAGCVHVFVHVARFKNRGACACTKI